MLCVGRLTFVALFFSFFIYQTKRERTCIACPVHSCSPHVCSNIHYIYTILAWSFILVSMCSFVSNVNCVMCVCVCVDEKRRKRSPSTVQHACVHSFSFKNAFSLVCLWIRTIVAHFLHCVDCAVLDQTNKFF